MNLLCKLGFHNLKSTAGFFDPKIGRVALYECKRCWFSEIKIEAKSPKYSFEAIFNAFHKPIKKK